MTTRGEYVVEVTSVPDDAFDVVRARIEHLLKLSPEKAEALLARVPGVVTKGLPAERALRVVLRLQSAGLSAVHRRLRPGELVPGARVERGDDPAESARVAARGDAGEVDEPTLAPAEPRPQPRSAPHAEPREPSLQQERSARSPRDTDVELTHDGFDDLYGQQRDPTGFDQIPSLDATRIDHVGAEYERDPKLTPMSEAGFGAADVVLPTEPSFVRRTPTLVDSGPVSRPLQDTGAPGGPATGRPRRDAGAAARAVLKSATPTPRPSSAPSLSDDADPTMIVPSGAEPPPSRRGQPTLTDADVLLDPPAGVSYRSTGGGTRRPLAPTPPPDDVLRSSGVDEEDLVASMERRRGRFGRRLSALVILPVALSWALTATFLYLLLPESAEGPVRSTLWVPLAAATAVAALAGALAAALATGRVVEDVVRLRDAAHRLAMGELEAPVRHRRKDELGDIAASLERLRVSLQEALGRLRKRV